MKTRRDRDSLRAVTSVDVRESLRMGSAVIFRLASDRVFCRKVEKAAARCIQALQRSRKILVCGNGGSASDALHFAAELVGRFERERRALAVMALTSNVSVLTAVANDYGYDRVFERQVEALGRRGDVLVAISTSGKSTNVNRALACAGRLGLYRIGLTGKSGGPQSRLVDLEIRIPPATTAHTQEAHIAVIHILCDRIESEFSRRPPKGAGY